MWSRIKKISSNNKTVIANLGYLGILQIISLFLPLLTYPYLIRVLGKEIYGEIVLAQAIMAYFSIMINWGFNISATKDIAVHRDNKLYLSEIVSAVFTVKLLLWMLSFLILLAIVYFIPALKHHKLLYFISFGICFNELLFQQYFFQGIEKMKYITLINLISRLIFFCMIFIFVKSQANYLYVPLFNSIGAFIGGLIAFYIIIFKQKIYLQNLSFSILKRYFLESMPFFFSRISNVVINKTNTVIIGIVLGYTEVSYYDLGQKILSVLLIPFDLINQVIYPKVAREKNMYFVRKVILMVLVLASLLLLGINIGGKYFIEFLGGSSMLPAINIVKILTINVLFISVDYFLGNTILVVKGFYKEFNKSVIYTGLFYLCIIGILFLSNVHNIYVFAFVSIAVELFCLGYRWTVIKKNSLFATN